MRENEKKTMADTAKKQNAGGNERDFRREVTLLLEHYPELKGKTLPDEVAYAAVEGEDLLAAYEAYLAALDAAEIDMREKQNAVQQQNRRMAERAPVRGISGGSAVKLQGEDDFLRGFNE